MKFIYKSSCFSLQIIFWRCMQLLGVIFIRKPTHKDSMMLATTERIEGRQIKETLGLVRGNTIRAKWFGKDIVAGLRQIIGGELKEYTEMLTEAREEALQRMIKEAEKLGADAVVEMRFSTSQIMANAAEILAYGTAVKLK